MKTSFSAFLAVSLMLLASLCPTLILAGPLMTPEMRLGNTSGSNWSSTNWSGYAVTGSNVTSVQGSWVVPSVTGTRSTTAYSSFWVGIDGFNSGTVEQTGTDSDVQRGKLVYYAWYEFYPQAMVKINTIAVSPGDAMSASVTYVTGSTFTVSINDTTTGKSYSTQGTVSNAARSSAEWIAEAPSSYFGVLPLANFAKVNFGVDATNIAGTCYATMAGVTGNIGSFTTAVQSITMVNRRGATKASPSPLSTDGTSFSVTWASAGP